MVGNPLESAAGDTAVALGASLPGIAGQPGTAEVRVRYWLARVLDGIPRGVRGAAFLLACTCFGRNTNIGLVEVEQFISQIYFNKNFPKFTSIKIFQHIKNVYGNYRYKSTCFQQM